MKTSQEIKEYKRQWQLKNRHRFRAYSRKYYLKNKEKVLAYSSVWKKRNVVKNRIYAKRSAIRNAARIAAYRIANKFRSNELQRTRRSKKRLELILLGLKKPYCRSDNTGLTKSEIKRRWDKKNKEHIRIYENKRRANNPQLAIKRRVSARVYRILKQSGLKKRKSVLKYIGIDALGLKRHIESLFKPGMSWSNRHLWHIDHKRPCSSFDLTDEKQQMLCFHYTNLQPLWWWENLSKSDKLVA